MGFHTGRVRGFGRVQKESLEGLRRVVDRATNVFMGQIQAQSVLNEERRTQEVIGPLQRGEFPEDVQGLVSTMSRLIGRRGQGAQQAFGFLGQMINVKLDEAERLAKEQQKKKPLRIDKVKQPVDGEPRDILIFTDPKTRKEIDRIDLGPSFVTPRTGQDPRVRGQQLEKEN
ncbi:MAG: hypothetical protein V3T23_07715, partial [Nitrososphaerales archaeon]